MTIEEQVAELSKKVDLILELLGKVVADPEPQPAPTGFVGPGPTFVNGAYLKLKVPLRADWEPSVTDVVATSKEFYGEDPSNAPEGKPLRSPAGYPLHYHIILGIVVSVKTVFAGVTFDNDAELDKYKQDRARRDANLPQR